MNRIQREKEREREKGREQEQQKKGGICEFIEISNSESPALNSWGQLVVIVVIRHDPSLELYTWLERLSSHGGKIDMVSFKMMDLGK